MLVVIDIEGEESTFIYKENILDKSKYDELKKWLDIKEYINGTCVSGKAIPRQQLWFHEEGKYFCDEWKCKYERWMSNEYTEGLKEIQNIINLETKGLLKETDYEVPQFNSVLINKYRDGEDSIKPHKDCPQSFGIYPIISVLSVGDTREINIKRIIYNENNLASLREYKNTDYNFVLPLKNNSLFIMAGASQKYFTHEIPKCDSNKTRYSLTFRKHLNNLTH
tara:strand:+ start:5726 stop:6394 length:669 start_codon:yes stop_codon:yes gene_type:complete